MAEFGAPNTIRRPSTLYNAITITLPLCIEYILIISLRVSVVYNMIVRVSHGE
jgi:hypothetical protein